ncbi:MAG TPA: hypothetical protein VNO21_21620 [Polyangiaceae bacterium]|nr:hypothetical protein [Polyangiaceae bacterium]
MHRFLFIGCWLVGAMVFAGGVGCSSVQSSAIRTGPLYLPPRSGPVGIYTANAPAGGRDLGFVEVHGIGDDGAIETLLPEFARRVADLGGNAAYVQTVTAHFEIVNYFWYRGTGYGCWRGRWCAGTTHTGYPSAEEVVVISMQGRAMTAPNQAGVQ